MSLGPHSAAYDASGDIILPEEEVVTSCVQTPLDRVSAATRSTLTEGSRQYRVTVEDGRSTMEAFENESRGFIRRLRDFLLMPVWVSGRKKRIVTHSRLTLFVLDVLRFGGTFAAIFLLLFGALNYQSFYEMLMPRITAVFAPPSIDDPVATPDATVEKRDLSSRSLSALPEVGPPDNLMIIPKLKLSVPLVEPPTINLLREDWPKVEEDIQKALLEGVVLYPGTAKPGQAGNTFITGHSSYYPFVHSDYKTVFARLGELRPGDEYWLTYGGDKHRYRVQSTKEVSPTDISVLDQPLDQRIATLMTCTPVGTTLRRLIVLAQEVDPATGITLQVGEKTTRTATKVQVEALPI